MPRRLLLLGFLLALVALLAWRGGRSAGESGVASSDAPGASEPALTSADESLAPVDPIDVSPISRAAASDSESATGLAKSFLTVRVIADASGTPEPFAEVLLLDANNPAVPPGEHSQFVLAGPDQRLERWGRQFRCDEQGVVRLPMPTRYPLHVAARARDRWVRKEFHAGAVARANVIELELARALHLRVLTLDEADRPVAGVAVHYCAMEGNQGRILRTATSGSDGIAELRHLREALVAVGWLVTEHAVCAGIAADPPVRVRFDPLLPPGEPLVLRIPATGSVEVEVLDQLGTPAGDGVEVVLQRVSTARRSAEAAPQARLWPDGARGAVRLPVVDGRVCFERIGLGLRLEYGADYDGIGRFERQEAAGPLDAGQLVRLTLRQAAALPVLTGRLVNDSGAPLPLTEWEAECYPEDRPLRLLKKTLRTDEVGRFRTAFPAQDAPSGRTLLLGHTSRDGRTELAVAGFTLPIDPGETDLGDVVLGGPILVAGIALDPERQPLAGAQGRIEALTFDAAGAAGLRGPYQVLDWRSGGDGRFVVRGAAPSGRYRLRYGRFAEQPPWYCADREFTSGSEDLELHFGPSPGLRGRAIADDEIPWSELRCEFELDGRPAGTGGFWPDGRFSVRPERAGTGVLRILTQEQGSPVWSRAGVVGDPQQATEIELVDLRGLLVATRLELRAPDGRPIGQARCWRRSSEGNWMPTESGFPHCFLTPDDRGTLLIQAGGYAEVETPLDGRGRTVEVPEPFRVAIDLHGLPVLPDGAAWSLLLSTTPTDAALPGVAADGILPEGSSRLELKCARPGNYQPRLSWQRARGSPAAVVPEAFGLSIPTIEVRAVGGLQHQSLAVITESVAHWVQQQ
jgi:hypothetical protein